MGFFSLPPGRLGFAVRVGAAVDDGRHFRPERRWISARVGRPPWSSTASCSRAATASFSSPPYCKTKADTASRCDTYGTPVSSAAARDAVARHKPRPRRNGKKDRWAAVGGQERQRKGGRVHRGGGQGGRSRDQMVAGASLDVQRDHEVVETVRCRDLVHDVQASCASLTAESGMLTPLGSYQRKWLTPSARRRRRRRKLPARRWGRCWDWPPANWRRSRC